MSSVQQKILVHPDFKPIFSTQWFNKDYWLKIKQMTGGANSGRGNTYFFKHQQNEFVLRHYYRGGLMAKISQDLYWLGDVNKTRSFAEFALHNHLFNNNLPVAKPVAARFIKKGLFYTADYISQKIPHAQTLYEYLALYKNKEIMSKVYKTINKFHSIGLNHVDLNIHNILIVSDKIYLIDFDKCTLNATQKVKAANLKRLRRSLKKELPELF